MLGRMVRRIGRLYRVHGGVGRVEHLRHLRRVGVDVAAMLVVRLRSYRGWRG